MTELIIGLLVGSMLLILVSFPETVETGLVGLWDAFVGVWRTVARLGREGR